MTRAGDPYEHRLDKRPANFVPLSPISFLERSAMVYPVLFPALARGIPT